MTAQVSFAQTTGRIEGRISDNSNGAIDYAKITITSETQKYEIAVNKEGEFTITLPVGEYHLIAQAKAFRPSNKRIIKVSAQQTTKINLSLNVNLDEIECKLPITGTIDKKTTGQKEPTKLAIDPSVKVGKRKRHKNK